MASGKGLHARTSHTLRKASTGDAPRPVQFDVNDLFDCALAYTEDRTVDAKRLLLDAAFHLVRNTSRYLHAEKKEAAMTEKLMKDATIEELQREVARRRETASAVPRELPGFDWTPLVTMVRENVRVLAETGRYGKDFEHYVYEEVMVAMYGSGYWNWANATHKGRG